MSFSIKLNQDTHITLPFSIRMTAIEFGRHWNLVKELQTFDLWITIKWNHCERTVVGKPISQVQGSSQQALSLSSVKEVALLLDFYVPCLWVDDENGEYLLLRIYSQVSTEGTWVGFFFTFQSQVRADLLYTQDSRRCGVSFRRIDRNTNNRFTVEF